MDLSRLLDLVALFLSLSLFSYDPVSRMICGNLAKKKTDNDALGWSGVIRPSKVRARSSGDY